MNVPPSRAGGDSRPAARARAAALRGAHVGATLTSFDDVEDTAGVRAPTRGRKTLKVENRPASTGESGLDLEVRAVASELGAVRRAMGDLAIPATAVEDARLLVSELVTNSVRHSGIRPDDRIRIIARIERRSLRIDVIDGGRGGRTAPARGIRPAPSASSGWGLYLVERLATRWGHGSGRFWFELDLDRPDAT